MTFKTCLKVCERNLRRDLGRELIIQRCFGVSACCGGTEQRSAAEIGRVGANQGCLRPEEGISHRLLATFFPDSASRQLALPLQREDGQARGEALS